VHCLYFLELVDFGKRKGKLGQHCCCSWRAAGVAKVKKPLVAQQKFQHKVSGQTNYLRVLRPHSFEHWLWAVETLNLRTAVDRRPTVLVLPLDHLLFCQRAGLQLNFKGQSHETVFKGIPCGYRVFTACEFRTTYSSHLAAHRKLHWTPDTNH
jgi:hypothetical protein